jgi:hypothetical protein
MPKPYRTRGLAVGGPALPQVAVRFGSPYAGRILVRNASVRVLELDGGSWPRSPARSDEYAAPSTGVTMSRYSSYAALGII